jgi:uncharacterized protein (DUF1697 family)
VTSYVALLRAVNVGGRNRLAMPELRAALTTEGLESVETVLQSGNVLLCSDEAEDALAETIGGTIGESFGLDIEVVVRSAEELAAVAARNPFLEADPERDPRTLHVAFLARRPTAPAIATLDPHRSPPDGCVVLGREAYLSYPNGSGRSRLTLDYLERSLDVPGTARNWRTVGRLAAALERHGVSPR